MYAIISKAADQYRVVSKLASEAEARAEISQLCDEAAEVESREAAEALQDALFVATLH